MSDAPTPDGPPIRQVPIAEIAEVDMDARLRPVSEAGVATVLASLTDLGVMTDPILLREPRTGGARFQLMAGAHRLEAAKRLGWETIPARVFRCDADRARLFEIDDNVAQQGLTPLDFAVFMEARKKAYEVIFLHSRHGGDRTSNAYREASKTKRASFCSSAAQVWGKSERAIQHAVEVGRMFGPDELRRLRDCGRALSFNDLRRIGKLPPEDRGAVFDAMTAQPKASVADAVKAARGAPVDPLPDDEQLALKLLAVVGRFPPAVHRRAASRLRERFPELFEDDGREGDAP